MKLSYLVDRKKKAYNNAMRKRNIVNHTAGKAQKNYKTPQKRFPKIKIKDTVKIILERKWTNKILVQLVKAVPKGYSVDENGSIRRPSK